MSNALTVSIPHRLGRMRPCAASKSGLADVRTKYSQFMTIGEETWTGDQLRFQVSAIGQAASGLIDVQEDHVQLEVTLPWLLHKLAERIVPTIQKEGTLMLEKK